MSQSNKLLHRQTVRVRNDRTRPLAVWVEPWAEEFELQPGDALDVAFVGNRFGSPGIVDSDDALSVYGWAGSAFIAIKDGQIAGPQLTLAAIVKQYLEVAAPAIEPTGCPLPFDEIASFQAILDSLPGIDAAAQQAADEIAGIVMHVLAECFKESDAAAAMIWAIAVRVIRLRGRLAGDLPGSIRAALWTSSPGHLGMLINEHSVSALPEEIDDERAATQPAERQSRPTSRGSASGPG